MEKNFSDPDMTNKSQENEHCNQSSKYNIKEMRSLNRIPNNKFDLSLQEFVEKSGENKEEVAENVGGVPTRLVHLQTQSEGGESILDPPKFSKKDSPEDLVRDLELHLGKDIPPPIRKTVLCVASVNTTENREATVVDIGKYLKVKRDYAEKLLEKAKKAQLIVACDKRDAKKLQYVLSNYQDVINVNSSAKGGNSKQLVLPNDITLLLAQELSNYVYVYHNLGFETNLTYIEDYEAFKWPISSPNNKQKVQTFRLDVKRNCTITISPTGTINISIGCTHRPYHFHTTKGLLQLFTSCGQILNLLQLSSENRMNVVSEVAEWNLTRFDYNKDISTLRLGEKYPTIHWNSSGVLRLKYLATFFQIYSKNMPFEGNVLRNEGHYVAKEKRNLLDITKDLIRDPNRHPFTTVEEMLSAPNLEIID